MRAIAILSVALLLVCAVPAFAGDADAEGDGEAYYFYGDTPSFAYEFEKTDSIRIEWKVRAADGGEMPFVPNGDGTVITVDLSGQPRGSRVMVSQAVYDNGVHVGDDVKYAIPLHIGASNKWTVTFVDGTTELNRQTVDESTMVKEGDYHVFLPETPKKDGYIFEGWYVDSFTKEFDPREPILGDTVVHAKWRSAGGSGTTVIKVVENHVVTFDLDAGLECDVLSVGDRAVAFVVGVVGGFELRDGTLSVTSNGGKITEIGVDMLYELSGIDRDIIVTVSGDVHPIAPAPGPDDPGKGFPWWIILVMIIIAAVVVALVVWKYRRE